MALDAPAGRDLIQQARKRFQVSEQAAQVRLSVWASSLRIKNIQ